MILARLCGLALSAALVLLALPAPVSAQPMDCTKARAPVEKAICASPALMRQDSALRDIYARLMIGALAKGPADAASLRDAQRRWIAGRDITCMAAGKPQTAIASCLAEAYAKRLMELEAAAKPANGQAHNGAPQPGGAGTGTWAPSTVPPAAGGAVQAVPVQAAGGPAASAPAAPAGQAAPAPAAAAPAAATPAAPNAALTSPPPTEPVMAAPIAASAWLASGEVPAAGEGQALLHVDVPGRFSIRAASKTGVALQLIDMIAGPGELTGQAGARDGRIDALLDKGTYKIRSSGAENAAGTAKLTVAPFVESGLTIPVFGKGASGVLADLQQRSFMLTVPKSGKVAVEAIGRSLQDLRLWRDGSDLANLKPEIAAVEPKPNRRMTRARLEGTVEPGVYVVTAYGGEKLPWANGTTDEPFHIRPAASRNLAAGLAEGLIGPFGVERFELSASANALRLELPESVPAMLRGQRGGQSFSAWISKTNREPVASLELPGEGKGSAEVVGFEGQSFRLRALRSATSVRVDTAGPYLVSVDVAGEGGDELPASAVLARFTRGKATVIASNAPHIGPGQAWRRKFNLRGPSRIIFEMTAAGTVATRTEGPGVRTIIEPVLGGAAPRSDGKPQAQYELDAGWYVLRVEPVDGARGILDLTLGQPGLLPALLPPAPPRAAIAFGVHELEKSSYLQALTGSGQGMIAGPKALALPADLSKEPVAIFLPAPEAAPQPAGAPKPPAKPAQSTPMARVPLEIPVRVPLGGAISATDAKGAPIVVTFAAEKAEKDARTLTVKLPAAKDERTVILSWTAKSQDSDAPAPVVQKSAPQALTAGTPFHFNLNRDEERNFRLDVAEGGLYRVETLGRLKTSLRIATSFLPNLAAETDNGTGHNALLQTYLRAGSYNVAVKVMESAGHLGLTAVPAPLMETAALVPESSVRASLAEGKGAVVPIEIGETGDYRLDIYGMGREFTVRLEDAEGWPLAAPGQMSEQTGRFAAGRYRLVVLPEDVDARMAVRLRKVVTETATGGHGPHKLAFDHTQPHQWREPAAKDAPRDPDIWEFVLAGDARVVLDITDGMTGSLIKEGAAEPVARIAHKLGFADKLAAGRYRVEARSLGLNDRLDYQLTLRSTELQPGMPRFVTLPATVPFAIAEDRVVSLTSFGRLGLNASLKDAAGHVVERLSGRTGDWNIGMSRWLRAGAYRLELAKPGTANGSGEESETAESNEPDSSTADSPVDESSARAVEVRLALPGTVMAPALALGQPVKVAAEGVHQFALPAGEPGKLMVAAAEGDAEIVLSLEREEAGQWLSAAFERGMAPVLAWPSDDKGGRLRLSAWAVDGGAARINVVAQTADVQPQALGKVLLKPLALNGMKGSFRAALVNVPQSGLVALAGQHEALSEGSTPGRVLAPASGGVLVPQSERLWLLARGDAERELPLEALPWPGAGLALALAEGERAYLPVAPVPEGKLRLWRADSSFGQPGLDHGEAPSRWSPRVALGIAKNSALIVSNGARPSVVNAGGREPLRLRAMPVDVTKLPAVKADGQFAGVLQPFTAQPVQLSGGQILLDLAAGTAAVSDKFTVWSGAGPVSRTLTADVSEVLLVNTGAKPAPVRITATPAGSAMTSLEPGKAFKRFFGAAGSQTLWVNAQAGDRLIVAGGGMVFTGLDGRVTRENGAVLSGAGEVTLEHGAGLMAAWIERGGESPWPAARAARPSLPASVALEGETMSFAIAPETPVLLHARTTAPVIVAFAQGDGQTAQLHEDQVPRLYPAGAEYHRYVPAGKAELRLYSPHDGPLAGTLELSATPVTPVGEGLGEAVALAPGGTALFGFEVTKAGLVGAGVRSEPDSAQVRLLDAQGKAVGQGVSMLQRLQPGRYVLEARVPADSSPATVRPAVVGIAPPPAGPPPDVKQQYLDMAGVKQAGGR